jgi:hypothetical protein
MTQTGEAAMAKSHKNAMKLPSKPMKWEEKR